MLGTDYPFPLGEDVAGKLIEQTDVIDDKTKVGTVTVDGRYV